MVQITCRPATHDDANDILVLLTELHEELDDRLPAMDNATVLMHIHQLVDKGFVVVAHTPEGNLAGSSGFGIDRWWFNHDSYYLADFWTFVSKRYRRTQTATKMFRAVKDFSKNSRVPVLMGIFSRDQQARKNKLYRRHFDVMGEMFTYGLREKDMVDG